MVLTTYKYGSWNSRWRNAKGYYQSFSEALCIPENQKWVHFTAKMPLNKLLLTSTKDIDVELDKEDEVCILYGTKNGLVALPNCLIR